jgi:hypothetical protein
VSLIFWLAVGFLIALGLIKPLVGDRWFRAIERYASGLARKKSFVVLGAGVFAVLSRIAILPLQPTPLPVIHDEFSNLLAADTFAHGRLTNPPHPMWIFFDTFHVLQHPTYASKYPPAEGLVLALGQLVGHPWFGTVLFLGLMSMAIAWMLQGWVPPEWALLVSVLAVLRLCLFNYWFDGYLGAAVSALGAALVLGAFPRVVHHRRFSDAFWLGIGALTLALSRPFEGFLFCLPVAVAVLFCFRQEIRQATFWKIGFRNVFLPAFAVLAAGTVWLGYYNWRVTGSPAVFPYFLYHREYYNFPIFAWQRIPPPLHYENPQFEAFFNVWQKVQFQHTFAHWTKRSYTALWEWWYVYLGSILAIPFLSLPYLWRDRRIRLPLIQVPLCALGLGSVVWFQPHYAAPLAAAIFVLLAQAMRHLRRFHCLGRPVGLYLSRMVVVIAFDWVLILAVHSGRYPSVPWSHERFRIAEQLKAMSGGHLVLVDYASQHNIHQEWVYNAADIDKSPIVWGRRIPGRDLTPLLSYFAGRSVWVLYPDEKPVRLVRYPGAGQTSEP